jgi:hypothetical protein
MQPILHGADFLLKLSPPHFSKSGCQVLVIDWLPMLQSLNEHPCVAKFEGFGKLHDDFRFSLGA